MRDGCPFSFSNPSRIWLSGSGRRERVRKRKEAQVQGGQFAGRGEAGPQQEAEGWGQSKAKGDVNGDGGRAPAVRGRH